MDNDFYLRVIPTVVVVTVVLVLEFLIPKKERVHKRRTRWVGNISIIVINRVFVWAILLLPISLGRVTTVNLFDLWELEGVLRYILGFLILDITIYFQHRLFHIFKPFWRAHLMHHTDRDLDFTSALRFHPFEILVSIGIKLGVVLLFGIDPVVLLIFEAAINNFAIFNHSNFAIPPRIESILRWFIVTPDLHRIHHSTKLLETNSNYGTIFIWWDKLFGSYTPEPQLGQDGMIIGVPGYRERRYQYIHWMLLTPFLRGDRDA